MNQPPHPGQPRWNSPPPQMPPPPIPPHLQYGNQPPAVWGPPLPPWNPPPPPKRWNHRPIGYALGATVVVIVAVVAVATSSDSDAEPADCHPISAASAFEYTDPDWAELQTSVSQIAAAATIDRDDGTYTAARLNDEQGTLLLWYSLPSGATTSVGGVTTLHSRFPDSRHMDVSTGSDGAKDAEACVGG